MPGVRAKRERLHPGRVAERQRLSDGKRLLEGNTGHTAMALDATALAGAEP